MVNRKDDLHRLQLDDDNAIHEKVETISAIKNEIFIPNGDALL
jgi:hypothetical protein